MSDPAALATIHNEKVKLVAAGLDRAATACWAGSILAPWSAWSYIEATVPRGLQSLTLLLTMLGYAALAFALNNRAQRVLERLR